MPGRSSQDFHKFFLAIAGVDEAGRGPLAGPVTASCVVLPPGYRNPGIGDSKQIRPRERERLFEEIRSVALASPAVSVGPRRIDRWNIRRATQFAMRASVARAALELQRRLGLDPANLKLSVLIDGNMLVGTGFPEESIIKGDDRIVAIGAASIIAKVTRDRLMALIDARYPDYCFLEHKGYATKKHLSLIRAFGPASVHRFTFAGVREHLPPNTAALLENLLGTRGQMDFCFNVDAGARR